MMISQ